MKRSVFLSRLPETNLRSPRRFMSQTCDVNAPLTSLDEHRAPSFERHLTDAKSKEALPKSEGGKDSGLFRIPLAYGYGIPPVKPCFVVQRDKEITKFPTALSLPCVNLSERQGGEFAVERAPESDGTLEGHNRPDLNSSILI
jgi:hypothetical protein